MAALGLLLAALGAAPAGAVDVVGRQVVRLAWEPATGPVAYYLVSIAVDGGNFVAQEDLRLREPQLTLGGEYGSSYRIRVAAYDAQGRSGPLSEPSEQFRFVAPVVEEPPVVAQPPIVDEPPVVAQPPIVDEPPVVEGPPGILGSPRVARPPGIAPPPSVGRPPGILRPPRVEGPPGIAGPPVVEEPPVIVEPPVVEEPPVVVEPPVAEEPPYLEPPPVVGDSPAEALGAPGDLDGDGYPEILLVHVDPFGGPPALRSLATDGNTVLDDRPIDAPPVPGMVPLGSADLDGDGRAELLFHGAEAAADVAAGLLEGAGPGRAANLSPREAGWRLAAVADFDGDLRADLLWERAGDPELVFWRMVDGIPAQVHRLDRGPQAADWVLRGAGDFDADGGVDLLFHHPGQQAAEIWFLDGFDLVEILPTHDVHFAADDAVLGDFDGDARCDVAWLLSSQGRFDVWLMDGAERHTLKSVSGVTVTQGRGITARTLKVPFDPVAVGDYDGDGRDDLVLQERESGVLHLRMMEDARSPRSGVIELTDPAWRAVGLP